MLRRTVLQGLGAGAIAGAVAPGAWAQGTGRWLRLESPNFVAFTSIDEQKSRQEVASLEAFDAVLSKLMPRSQRSPMKLNVYIAGRTADIQDAWGPGYDFDVGGFYNARVEEVRAVSLALPGAERQREMPRHGRAMDARTLLFHEYAHHYILSNNNVGYPAWYNEGFAEFTSTVEFNDKGANLGKAASNRAQWLVLGDWLPIEKFLRQDVRAGEEVAQFYAQSWLAAHYLFEKQERAAGFEKYLAALQAGGDIIGAFQPAFGITIGDFDKELRAYRKSGLGSWTVPGIKPDGANITVQRLSASADDLMMPATLLRSLPPRSRAESAIAKVREQAKKYPGDVFAMKTAALAEVWYGDLPAARKQIDAIVARDVKDAEAQHLSGICDLRLARQAKDTALLKRAQNAFGRAHQLDNTRASSMYRYVECGFGIVGSIDAHLLDVLLSTYQMAPQIRPIAETTAQALMQNQRMDEAVRLLRPLSADPHSMAGAFRAKDLLDAIASNKPVKLRFAGMALVDTDLDEDDA